MSALELKASLLAKLGESRMASLIFFGVAGVALGAASLAPLEIVIANLLGLNQDVATLLAIKVAVIGALVLTFVSMGWRTRRESSTVQSDAQLTWDLRRLLAGSREVGRLFVMYQPKLDLQSDRIVGAEALLRWHHPTRGFVSPAHFIAIAETHGLIGELTRRVVPMVASQIRTWKDQGRDISVALNVSGRDLDEPNFQTLVESSLRECGLEPGSITIELTETVALTDQEETRWVLTALKERGFRFSMDDFGTGYSSLTVLHNMPFSEVKIDQLFVRTLLQKSTSHTIVSAMIGLAKGLGIKVVAEGIEDLPTLTELRRLGVDEGQGYAIGRPMPPDSFEQWLDDNGMPAVQA